MDPGSRVERDPMSGAQQTSDESGTGGQWDDPISRGQGKWETRQGKSLRFANFPCCPYAQAPVIPISDIYMISVRRQRPAALR